MFCKNEKRQWFGSVIKKYNALMRDSDRLSALAESVLYSRIPGRLQAAIELYRRSQGKAEQALTLLEGFQYV